MDGCISSANFRTDRLEAAAGSGISTATELADTLVRKTKIPFRTAHQIVGALAAKGETPKIRDLDEAAERIAGFRPSERSFGEEELKLKAALDPRENVALRSRTGGPAPAETKRMIADWAERIKENESLVGEMRGKVDGALELLREMR